MAITCTPSNLASLAECYACLSQEQRDAIKVYLLQQIAGLGANTPEELAALAKCFQCVPDGQLKQIEAYLICQAANGGSGPAACANVEGVGDPT